MKLLALFHLLLLIGSVIATPTRRQVRLIDETAAAASGDLVKDLDDFYAFEDRGETAVAKREFDLNPATNRKAACLIVAWCIPCAFACLIRMEVTSMQEAAEKAERERG